MTGIGSISSLPRVLGRKHVGANRWEHQWEQTYLQFSTICVVSAAYTALGVTGVPYRIRTGVAAVRGVHLHI